MSIQEIALVTLPDLLHWKPRKNQFPPAFIFIAIDRYPGNESVSNGRVDPLIIGRLFIMNYKSGNICEITIIT